MHEMRTTAIDDPGVCQFVCRAASRDFAVQTQSERMDIRFGVETGYSTNIRQGSRIFPRIQCGLWPLVMVIIVDPKTS